VEKQPTKQGLKARCLAIGRRIPPPRAPACPIAASAHKVSLRISELLIKPLKSQGLGVGTHYLHNLLVEGVGAAWTLTALQAVMKLPDRITQPGQL
jgi:hypothetical protein